MPASSFLVSLREAMRGGEVSARLLWILYGIAAVSLLPHIFLRYIGEEGVYTVVTQEMWVSQNYAMTTLYGFPYGRPGLFAWLTLPVAKLLGWDHILIATRLVTIAATVATGLLLAAFANRLFKNATLAAFAALIYLSGDVLFYRGWLAYADPLYGLFIFIAIASLWLAVEERRNAWLVVAVLALIASLLTKIFTGYVFYGTFGLVLLWRHRNRMFLFNPVSLLLHAAALAFPFAWGYLVGDSHVLSDNEEMTNHHVGLLLPRDWQSILSIVVYPLRLIVLLLPVSAVLLYLAYRKQPRSRENDAAITILLWALTISVLPYWFLTAPPRHLTGIYPFFALAMTLIVFAFGAAARALTVQALVATIAVAYVASVIGFPLYHSYLGRDYAQAAARVAARVAEAPLYTDDDNSVGLSLASSLNTLRGPARLIRRPPADFTSGYLLTEHPRAELGIAEVIHIGKLQRYLYCRGEACATRQ